MFIKCCSPNVLTKVTPAHSRNLQRSICIYRVFWTPAILWCQAPPWTPRLSDARGLERWDQEVKALCPMTQVEPSREAGWDCGARERTRGALTSHQGLNSASAPSLSRGCGQTAYCLCCPCVGTVTFVIIYFSALWIFTDSTW